jgi:hypothetical protein
VETVGGIRGTTGARAHAEENDRDSPIPAKSNPARTARHRNEDLLISHPLAHIAFSKLNQPNNRPSDAASLEISSI